MKKKEKIDLILRRCAEVFNEDTLILKLNSDRKLIIKLGDDPSRPDLHLGHTVNLYNVKYSFIFKSISILKYLKSINTMSNNVNLCIDFFSVFW